jgi:hypothetical protein
LFFESLVHHQDHLTWFESIDGSPSAVLRGPVDDEQASAVLAERFVSRAIVEPVAVITHDYHHVPGRHGQVQIHVSTERVAVISNIPAGLPEHQRRVEPCKLRHVHIIAQRVQHPTRCRLHLLIVPENGSHNSPRGPHVSTQ